MVSQHASPKLHTYDRNAHADSCACVDRGFKALKQIVKLHYKLGNTGAMLTAYRQVPFTPISCPHKTCGNECGDAAEAAKVAVLQCQL